MQRRLSPAVLPLLVLAGLLLCMGDRARAQGLWSTYLHASSCNDLLALPDTVWVATGEAGLLRYARSTDTWSSITRAPSGLAGNNVTQIAFDRSGNLYAAVPGKGVSRLGTDGRWSLINAFDGLPSDTTLTMRALGDTVLIGTTRGLALWDGSAITGAVPDLGTPSPFADNNINGFARTGDTLFVSTPKGVYLARFTARLATWTRVSDGLPIDPDQNIRGIVTDGHNVLTLASGRNPSNPAQSTFSSFVWNPAFARWFLEFPPNNSAVRRLRDDFGTILATTSGGVFVRAFNGTWTLVGASPVTDNSDTPALEVGADPAGRTFAMERSGPVPGLLLEQALPAWRQHLPPGPVGNACRSVAWANGSVYACYFDAGVSRLRDGVWRNYPPSSACNAPACDEDTTFRNPSFAFSLLIDRTGNKWIGMWNSVFTRFDDDVTPPRFVNTRYQSIDPESTHVHSCIHALAFDRNPGSEAGIWCGLDSDRIGSSPGDPLGLDVYDTSGTFVRNYFTNYPGINNGLIRALELDRDDFMWVGYKNDGLSTFKVPASLSTAISLSDVPGSAGLNVFGIAAYGDSIWVLTDKGLFRFRESTKSLSSQLAIAAAPPLASVHPIAVTPDGSVYVGTGGGLRVHRRGQLPVDYTPDNSPLADLEVRAVYAEPSGAVWVGTASGINRFDPNYRPPSAPRLPSLHVTLYPNPSWRTGIGFELRLKGGATSYDGEIFDLGGRVVHRFRTGGNGQLVWDGRDLEQNWVGSGVYFVRVRGGGAEALSRLVVLH